MRQTLKRFGSKVTSADINTLSNLGDDLDIIKSHVEQEIECQEEFINNSFEWKQACGRELGNFFEYIISLGVALKVPFLSGLYGNMSLYSWDKINGQVGKRIQKITWTSSRCARMVRRNFSS